MLNRNHDFERGPVTDAKRRNHKEDKLKIT